MSYVLPALRVHQEFEAIADATDNRLYACIIAPQYGLHRYSEEDEQAELGAYDPSIANVFGSYPDKAAGSSVDVASNKLYLQDAVLKYLTDGFAGGPLDGLLVDGGNKIRSADLVFKTQNGYARSAGFGTRDVQLGDPIKVVWGATTKETTVAGFVAEVDDATIGAVGVVTDYDQAEAESITDAVFAAYTGVLAASAASYDGLAVGILNESYVCTVIATDGTLANSYVRVVSASGTDNQASVQLLLGPAVISIGTRGAELVITDDASLVTMGDTFTVNVSQEYTELAPTLPGSPAYLGTQDTTYVIRITTGGVVGTDEPIFTVYTTNGVDSGLPTTITAAGTFAVGHFGTAIDFLDTAPLLKGAEYTIAVTAEGAGAVKTLILADSLVGAVVADVLTVDFHLIADFELEDSQWISDETSITVAAAAEHLGTYLGVDQIFEIMGGDIYIDYRELLITYNDQVTSVQTIDEAELVCGPAVVENPLGLLVNKALTNSGGVEVYFITVDEDTDTGYIEAITALTTEDTPYSLVPHSDSLAVRDAIQAHCLSMSSPENGQWRIYWISAEVDREVPVYVELSPGAPIEASVSDNGSGQFTQWSADGALCISNNTQPGDIVRINYSTDIYGNESYEEYIVDTVDSEIALTLLTGPDTAITVPIKSEIWHEASRDEYADEISAIATHSNHRRGYAIWSEPVYDGLNPDGLPLSAVCAAAAGLRSGVAPHRPLTNVSLAGFTMTRTVNFRSSQLNTMAGNGIWLVVQTLEGEVYNRHQVSTDNEDINHREQTITTNLDHISRDFKAAFANFYGRGNVSPAMLQMLRYTAEQQFTVIMARPYPDTIGPQLLSAVITKLEVNAALRDQVDLVIEPELPYPLNNLDIYFIIS